MRRSALPDEMSLLQAYGNCIGGYILGCKLYFKCAANQWYRLLVSKSSRIFIIFALVINFFLTISLIRLLPTLLRSLHTFIQPLISSIFLASYLQLLQFFATLQSRIKPPPSASQTHGARAQQQLHLHLHLHLHLALQRCCGCWDARVRHKAPFEGWNTAGFAATDIRLHTDYPALLGNLGPNLGRKPGVQTEPLYL